MRKIPLEALLTQFLKLFGVIPVELFELSTILPEFWPLGEFLGFFFSKPIFIYFFFSFLLKKKKKRKIPLEAL